MFKYIQLKLKISNQFLCKIGIHQSDKDYGFDMMGSGKVFSNCEYCRKLIHHKRLFSVGGGN